MRCKVTSVTATDEEDSQLARRSLIREEMAARNLSQAEAARRLHTTEATVSRLLSGELEITERWLQRFVLMLGLEREHVVITGHRRVSV